MLLLSTRFFSSSSAHCVFTFDYMLALAFINSHGMIDELTITNDDDDDRDVILYILQQ